MSDTDADSRIDAEILRRHFVAIATTDYDDLTCPPLPAVLDEVKTLRDWLCDTRLGYGRVFTECYPELARNPSKKQIRDTFEEPEQPWNHSDAAFVFVTGHGVTAHGAHWMVLQHTSTGQLHTTALRSSDLVGWFAETGIEHLLIVLDLCYAGTTAAETAAFEENFPPTWLALASVTRKQQARAGALTAAIAEFLTELASPIGEQFNHGPYLRVDQFLDAIQNKLGDEQRLAQLQPGLPSLAQSPCLPNPRYTPDQQTVRPARRDLALRRQDLDAHWDPRARGVASGAQGGWLFTGRTQLMRCLIDATADQPTNGSPLAAASPSGDRAPVLVTGAAGTGKSAVLARLVTLSDPDFCARYADLVNAIPAALRPAPGAVDAAVLATGKVPHEVLGQIYEAVSGTNAPISSVVPTLDELRGVWWSWLQTQGRRIVVVVDALDEAQHPPTLLTEVLAQLDPPGQSGRVRLIVGVRSPGGPEDPASAKDEEGRQRSLADLAERVLGATRLRVDEPPWWNPQDLAGYAIELLTAAPDSPYAELEHQVHARTVANALAAQAGKSFLITRIAATSLAHRAQRIDPQDPAWRATITEGVLGVFRDDLYATLSDPADRQRAIHLLRAVAFAYGRGLPWRQIWSRVANAVADDPERTYGDGDIAWLLQSRLGAYLVTDREDGITVYRLFHDVLRTTLREQADALLHPQSR